MGHTEISASQPQWVVRAKGMSEPLSGLGLRTLARTRPSYLWPRLY